jgi:hypothetical protein
MRFPLWSYERWAAIVLLVWLIVLFALYGFDPSGWVR